MAKLKPYIYAFVGPQGSGKGTQAHKIKRRFNMSIAATGDVIRDEAASGSDVGKRAHELISAGNLVTLDIWQEIMGKYLENQDLSGGILLDGSPRSVTQAKALEKLIAEKNFPSIKIIFLNIPRTVALERLAQRRICPIGKQTTPDLFCQEHQIATVTREDDTPEAIERRLDLYYKETEPVIDFYRSKNAVIEINGDRPIDDVTASIIEELTNQELTTND